MRKRRKKGREGRRRENRRERGRRREGGEGSRKGSEDGREGGGAKERESVVYITCLHCDRVHFLHHLRKHLADGIKI